MNVSAKRARDRPGVEKVPRQPQTLIVGSGRCGSGLISDIVKAEPTILSLSEFFSSIGPDALQGEKVSAAEIWRRISVPRVAPTWLSEHGIQVPEVLSSAASSSGLAPAGEAVAPICSIALPHLVSDYGQVYRHLQAFLGDLSPSEPCDQYALLFEFLCQKLGKSSWVERSGASYAWIGELVRAFPEASIVHIVRSGEATALSMSLHPSFRLAMIGLDIKHKVGYDPFLLPVDRLRRCPDASVAPLWPDRLSLDRFYSYPLPVERFGALWSLLVASAVPILRRMKPSMVLHVRYEDLVRSPRAELRRIGQFLGISDSDRWVEVGSRLVRGDTKAGVVGQFDSAD